jgi:[NiFe]-hydrogenase assembly, chaperone, HybE
LNLIGVESPEVGQPALPTHSLRLRFPAGDVDFSPSELKGFRRLVSCSLFSTMSEFFDQLAARAAPAKPRAPDEKLDRRALLIGRRGPPRAEEGAR